MKENGTTENRTVEMLLLVHQARDEGLKSCGLEITPNDLVALYKGTLEDE